MEQKNQENKCLIEEKAFVSQLQDQHSIELAKLKTKLEDAHQQYQNTLEEEQSKLQRVTQQLKESESRIDLVETGASVWFARHRGEFQSLKAERDQLLQDIEKMSQSEATLQKEFQVQSEEIQTRKVKCGRTLMQEPKNLFISGAGAKT